MATVTLPPVSPSPAVEANDGVPRLASGLSSETHSCDHTWRIADEMRFEASAFARSSTKTMPTT